MRIVSLWQLKSALFKALVKQHKTIAIPAKEFYLVSSFIDEHKYIPTQGVFVKMIPNQSA